MEALESVVLDHFVGLTLKGLNTSLVWRVHSFIIVAVFVKLKILVRKKNTWTSKQPLVIILDNILF